MKKLLLFVILFGTLTSFAQTELSEIDKLKTTCKIWGFFKYYHPKVAKGKFNWDNQLFDILPETEKAKTKQELSEIYINWINSLGKVKKCKSCKKVSNEKYFYKNFNLSWTQDTSIFTTELCNKLKFIEENRFQGKNNYVSTIPSVGNIKIQNEPQYENFDWNEKKYRILSLFKYWNIIEYFYPYKYQTDKNWDLVLENSIPQFSNPNTELDYHLAMLELIASINDSHGGFGTKLLFEYFGEKWIAAKFTIIENKAVITEFYNDSLAKIDDIRIGDVVLYIDGKSVQEILEEKNKYNSASNISAKLRNSYYFLFNGSTDSVYIDFERNGNVQHKKINRYSYKQLNYQKRHQEKWKIINDNIGYVNMGVLEKDDVPKMIDSLKNTKAIIFDIRNYPKGTLYLISEYLNNEPKEFAKFIYPDVSYPGRFIWTKSIHNLGSSTKRYTGDVILLINEKTQSHAEFTIMCLQTANNVTVIGSQTAGADGNVSHIEIIGGLKTLISGIGVFYPDDKETQRIGIVPDIEVKPTIDGIRNGIDEVLEKAIEHASK